MPPSKLALALSAATFLAASLATVEASAEEAPPKPADEESAYTRSGLFGPLRFGPSFGAGVPDGLRIGLNARFRGLVSVGAGVTTLPETALPPLGATLARSGGEGWARLHPFRGAFFLGAAMGSVTTRTTATTNVQTSAGAESASGRGSVTAMYVAPQLGFQWVIRPGITVGCDAGVQIPVASGGTSFDVARGDDPVDAAGAEQATSQGAAAMRFIGSQPVPLVHLLDVGFVL